MVRSLVNLNNGREFRAMEEVFEQLFGSPVKPNGTPTNALPIDVTEKEGNLVVRASVPGIEPNELEIQIENDVLTIRGETKHQSESKDERVYRREMSYGSFARSVRLPDNLNLDSVDAEFKNGIVTITLPRVPEEKPKAIKVGVRTSEPAREVPTAE